MVIGLFISLLIEPGLIELSNLECRNDIALRTWKIGGLMRTQNFPYGAIVLLV